MDELSADVVIAGGGVGGLMAAHAAAELGVRVVVLTGSPGASHQISSINAAFGEVPEDAPERLFDDMFRSGHYINNPAMAARIAQDAGVEIRRLASMGVPFVRDGSGFARRRAAGSTWTRSVFTEGMAGEDISTMLRRALAEDFSDRVVLVNDGWLVDLEVRDGAIAGALAFDKRAGAWLTIAAPSVVLATGGGGQLFAKTTNQPGSRGSGYAMAAEAGAELMDLEFVSFEPFVLQVPESIRGRSLPTTVMNEGARLLNARGEQFLGSGPMPSKDVVCRLMVREVREGRGTASGSVIYDLSDVDDAVLARYAKIGRSIHAAGSTQLEVMPAQHYFMGGVRTDENGTTSVPGLFAVGEASAGAHGAHRMAGGGGSEVVALGPVVGRAASDWARAAEAPALTQLAERPELLAFRPNERDSGWAERIRAALDDACGIIRSEDGLAAAAVAISTIRREIAAADHVASHIGRSALLASGIVTAARMRTESRGDHYRVDFPRRDDYRWLGNIVAVVPAGSTDLEHRFVPARSDAR